MSSPPYGYELNKFVTDSIERSANHLTVSELRLSLSIYVSLLAARVTVILICGARVHSLHG